MRLLLLLNALDRASPRAGYKPPIPVGEYGQYGEDLTAAAKHLRGIAWHQSPHDNQDFQLRQASSKFTLKLYLAKNASVRLS
jgi:hypothetical protein